MTLMQLQKRDREILKFVYLFRAVSFSQLQNRFFSKTFRTVGSRRIRMLASAGYMRIFQTGEEPLKYRYVQLTDKGWNEIRELWPFEIDNPLIKSESPIHDLRLASLVPAFERLSTMRQFMTENLLQSSGALKDDPKFSALSRLQSDGAIVLKPQNGDEYLYGFEFEISKKTPDRYREKLMNYYLASGIDGVLYVSNSQSILDAIARM
jgi:hypothetical protein